MSVYVSTLTLEGAKLEGDNPLPQFRARNPHRDVVQDGSFTAELLEGFGDDTGERILPYRVQDRYSRKREPIVLKTIVLENERLKATFLPDYGGRLYSLYDKIAERDVLYRNPVFQPANLAILNAWFSGGIEWNIGHVGHTFATCSPVHAVKLTDGEGAEFLRIYEYERCKGLFWHIDFHLPPGAEELQVYVRIANDNEEAVPMYWWTNIAVQETERARVFSGTDEAVYIAPGLGGHGLGRLPDLPSLPGADASYPMNYPFSNEYFFQTPSDCLAPWEAVAYEDGRLFYERSTSRLRYRKMFCWGAHEGGRRWRDFLAKPAEGGYVEVQGGFAPTQLHGQKMPGRTEWDFAQLIGMRDMEASASDAYADDWLAARDAVAALVEERIGEDGTYAAYERMRGLAELEGGSPLHAGSGWGALERLRREAASGDAEGAGVPSGFAFGEATLGEAQAPWLSLLQDGRIPDASVEAIPSSWMVQEEWIALLRESLADSENPENRTWTAYMHYGVMLLEKGLEREAEEAWQASLALRPSAWVYRNLAALERRNGDGDRALGYLEQAYLVSGGFPDRAFAEEYLQLLVQRRYYDKAWLIFESLPETIAAGDRVRIILGEAALALGKDEYMRQLFETEFAVIREGEVLVIDLWYKYNARRIAAKRGVELTEELVEEAKRLFPPPGPIDFRMIGS